MKLKNTFLFQKNRILRGVIFIAIFFVFGSLLGGFFSVHSARAQAPVAPRQCAAEEKGGFLPCGRSCDDPDTTLVNEEEQCNFCHIFYLFNRTHDFIMGRLIPAAALLLFAIAGFLFATSRGDAGQRAKATAVIRWAVIGYALALISWLILNSLFTNFGLKQWTGISGGEHGGNWWQFSCGITKPVSTPTPAPLPIPVPSVTLSADKMSLEEDKTLLLSWSSSNAETCKAFGDWSGTWVPSSSAEIRFCPRVEKEYKVTYGLECSGPGGTAKSNVVEARVTKPALETATSRCEPEGLIKEIPVPSVSFFSSPERITEGDDAILAWNVSNGQSCKVGGVEKKVLLGGETRGICSPACYEIVTPKDADSVSTDFTYELICKTPSEIKDKTTIIADEIFPPQNWSNAWEEQRFIDLTARVAHTTTEFNGRLWVAGGLGKNGEYKKDVWAYDSFRWKKMPDLPTARAYHTAAALDGKLWVMGGKLENGTFTNEVLKLVPDENAPPGSDTWFWEPQKNAPAPWKARIGHVSVVFKDPADQKEKIWILGGELEDGTFKNDVWAFDGETETWEIKEGAGWKGRAFHTAVVLKDPKDEGKEKIWVMGGEQPVFLHDVWVWNGVSGREWERIEDAPWSGRIGHSVLEFNGKILIMGGLASGELQRDAWSFSGIIWKQEEAGLPTARMSHTATVYRDAFDGEKKVWLIGGSLIDNDIWTFNERSWTRRLDFRWRERLGQSSVVWKDSADKKEKIWVTGGLASGEYTEDTWAFNGVQWEQKSFHPGWPARAYHASIIFGNKIWIFGGLTQNGSVNDIWSWQPSGAWQKEDLDCSGRINECHWSARYGHAAVLFNGKLWVLGGFAAIGQQNDVWSSSDGVHWEQIKTNNIWEPRYFHSAVAFNDKMWVMGGVSGSSFRNDIWHSSDGIHWTEASAPWSARMGHTSLVFHDPLDGRDKIWMIGGEEAGGELKNDVWSFDGNSWEKRADTSAWSGRTHHSAVVFGDSKDGKKRVWVLGGISKLGNLHDVWYAPRKY
ncbi:MAG: hypothetical protein HYS15_03490 [Candidatus Spechtbacteria bacterium]|nr:hypothetical protein [Candidatus Spechtbacteria bacterium]